jgi:hypothetical protein
MAGLPGVERVSQRGGVDSRDDDGQRTDGDMAMTGCAITPSPMTGRMT